MPGRAEAAGDMAIIRGKVRLFVTPFTVIAVAELAMDWIYPWIAFGAITGLNSVTTM